MSVKENKNLDFFEPRKLNNGKTVLSNRDRSRNIPFDNSDEIEQARKEFEEKEENGNHQ